MGQDVTVRIDGSAAGPTGLAVYHAIRERLQFSHVHWARANPASLTSATRQEYERRRWVVQGYEVWRAIQDDIDDERRRVP